jgi:hypothetical protein
VAVNVLPNFTVPEIVGVGAAVINGGVREITDTVAVPESPTYALVPSGLNATDFSLPLLGRRISEVTVSDATVIIATVPPKVVQLNPVTNACLPSGLNATESHWYPVGKEFVEVTEPDATVITDTEDLR